ncbi:MAG TPA: mRNA-degrading endonuclease, partial [Alphaproteobacteria bacterium]|nr:mRNA-degrading endonuclease [Alphaproteobacteria bacterium]
MVRKKGYPPDRGDIVWLEFNPQAGREQRGR